jgi:hypothetical protein
LCFIRNLADKFTKKSFEAKKNFLKMAENKIFKGCYNFCAIRNFFVNFSNSIKVMTEKNIYRHPDKIAFHCFFFIINT